MKTSFIQQHIKLYVNFDTRNCEIGTHTVSTQVRQSEGSGFKSWSGQIAYFHGVKTRFSTLGTGDVPRGSDSAGPARTKFGGIKERLERLESSLPVYFGN